jgi:hypothetical protein
LIFSVDIVVVLDKAGIFCLPGMGLLVRPLNRGTIQGCEGLFHSRIFLTEVLFLSVCTAFDITLLHFGEYPNGAMVFSLPSGLSIGADFSARGLSFIPGCGGQGQENQLPVDI